jgi:hypothetical protein
MIRYAGDATGINGGTPVAGTGSLDGFTIQEFKTPGSSTFAVDLNVRLAATLARGSAQPPARPTPSTPTAKTSSSPPP